MRNMNLALSSYPGLKPLARDHGVALVCAHYGRKAVRAALEERESLALKMRTMCREYITPSLEDEQWILSPLIGELSLRVEFQRRLRGIRLLAEQLEAVDCDPGLSLLSMLTNALDDYVRWQYRVLMPRIKDGLDLESARLLTRLTDKVEAGRHRPTQVLHASRSEPASN
ncbi:MAG: hypothetical protein HY986_14095 [Candidatus Melainabacteria bacterium]|nr:hypothetical protein [Candidatus Melainabacteria bacterium]